MGIGFRRRDKVPLRVLISADGTHTQAATLLRRRGQGGAAADGAELYEVISEGGAALVVNLFPHLGGKGLGFGDLGGGHFFFKKPHISRRLLTPLRLGE